MTALPFLRHITCASIMIQLGAILLVRLGQLLGIL
jgi:hypothetical protein